MRNILGNMLQIILLLKMVIWLNKIKKNNIVTVPCSSGKDQILTIWYFHAKTPNSDLHINKNMDKKMTKNQQ